MPDERVERCADCRFWDISEQPISKPGMVDLGACRRMPPVVVTDMLPIISQRDKYPEEAAEYAEKGIWPLTCDCDWCGEFQPNGRQLRSGINLPMVR